MPIWLPVAAAGDGAELSYQTPASAPPVASGVNAKFAWTEYEQLMISEAFHRGETVYNVALPLMRETFPNRPPCRVLEIRRDAKKKPAPAGNGAAVTTPVG